MLSLYQRIIRNAVSFDSVLVCVHVKPKKKKGAASVHT